MASVIETLPLPKIFGEAPHWAPKNSSLYLVDIHDKQIIRYHQPTESVYSIKLDAGLGFVTPVADSEDELVVGAGLSLFAVQWDGRSEQAMSQRIVQNLEDEPAENKINDGKADPSGRLWFGTVNPKNYDVVQSSFFSYAKGAGLQKHLSDVGISNGLTWDEKRNLMYYIDSLCQSVDVFNYSPSGKIEGRRKVVDIDEPGFCLPDGMTIDTEGRLWVALFGRGKVVQIDPEVGKVVSEVSLPTPHVTSVAWGGPELTDLFVTSASLMDSTGLTYRVRGLAARGLPMHEAVL